MTDCTTYGGDLACCTGRCCAFHCMDRGISKKKFPSLEPVSDLRH